MTVELLTVLTYCFYAIFVKKIVFGKSVEIFFQQP